MTTDLRTLIRAADPVTRDHYDDAALLDHARQALAVRPDVEVAAAATERADVLELRAPAPKRRRRIVAVVTVAAALAAGAVLVPTLLHSTSAAHQRAAALLDSAADAITATDPPAVPGQYWELSSSGFALVQSGSAGAADAMPAELISQESITYVPIDGDGPSVRVDGQSRILRHLAGPPLPAGTAPVGSTSGVTAFDPPSPASWGVPDAAFLAGLPRAPAALMQRIRHDSAGAGNSADGEVVVTIADVLRTGIVPADLRAALYRVLADVPGVEVAADSAEVDGVSGVAFAYGEDANGIRQELIVDPTNGELVGERQVATQILDGIPAGTVIGQSATTRELVDRVPDAVERALQGEPCTVGADLTVTCER